MTSETAFFVQFPHPGGEHNPRTDVMPWNTGDHRRKFLIAPGHYTNGDGQVLESELVFWGEWEAPSTVVQRWPASGRLPRALHRPWWTKPGPQGPRQNTDPWVFGEQMLYSNCKQVTAVNRGASSMQSLSQGSIICFGTTIAGQFCLDTVFVVASVEPWIPGAASDLEVDEAFRTCTANSIAASPDGRHADLTLYRGATIQDPVDGMFSFVPALPAQAADPRFARPLIESRFIKPSNRQSTWGSKRPLHMSEVHSLWEEVRDQVLAAELALAVHVQTPDLSPQDSHPATAEELPQRECVRC